jgi:hypothetical protein
MTSRVECLAFINPPVPAIRAGSVNWPKFLTGHLEKIPSHLTLCQKVVGAVLAIACHPVSPGR